MKQFILLLWLILPLNHLLAQDGKIISRERLNIFENEKLADRISNVVDNQRQLKPAYTYLDSVVIEEITYLSDDLKVTGYLAYPSDKAGKATDVIKKYPCVIYNRGGNKEFGSLNEYKAVFILAKVASWGYVVAGSQYRGNVGGEGKEEFGGADVNDVLNLVPFLENLENTDAEKIGLYGWSRGGMMTYLALSRSCRFKAAIVGAGLTDLWAWMETRQDTIESVYGNNIPNYSTNTKAVLDARSAIKQVDRICKTTPILMLHGTADWRVDPSMVLDLSKAFIHEKVPHRLVMFEGGDHGLQEFRYEVNALAKLWLKKYLVDEHDLPELEKHGD